MSPPHSTTSATLTLFLVLTGTSVWTSIQGMASTPHDTSVDVPPTQQLRRKSKYPRMAFVDGVAWRPFSHAFVPEGSLFVGDALADPTRLYPRQSSQDSATMEKRYWPHHEADPDCEPMAEWQSFQFPTCNVVHEQSLGDRILDESLNLLSAKGYWRYAWKLNSTNSQEEPPTVWKTFKYVHSLRQLTNNA